MLIGCAFEFRIEVREVVRIFSFADVTLCTLPAAISLMVPSVTRHNSIMADGGFNEVQRKLQAIASELKTATDPGQRRELLRVMSRLVAEAERISSQPPKMLHKPEQP